MVVSKYSGWLNGLKKETDFQFSEENVISQNQYGISRIELFKLLCEKPTTEIAKELGISDVALGKMCRRMQVPKPPRGYWARVTAGQIPKRPALPAYREVLREN